MCAACLYLDQLLPPLLTCLLGQSVAPSHGDKQQQQQQQQQQQTAGQWALRDDAAALVALVCRRFGPLYRTLQPRITRTLRDALAGATPATTANSSAAAGKKKAGGGVSSSSHMPRRPLSSHYGAIVALTKLGPSVVGRILMPGLGAYVTFLRHEGAKGASGASAGSSATGRASEGGGGGGGGGGGSGGGGGGGGSSGGVRGTATRSGGGAGGTRAEDAQRCYSAVLVAVGTFLQGAGSDDELAWGGAAAGSSSSGKSASNGGGWGSGGGGGNGTDGAHAGGGAQTPSLAALSALFGEDLLPFMAGRRCGCTTARLLSAPVAPGAAAADATSSQAAAPGRKSAKGAKARKALSKAAVPGAGGGGGGGGGGGALYDVEFANGHREMGISANAVLETGGVSPAKMKKGQQISVQPAALSEPFLLHTM